MIDIILVEPEIAGNVGAVARSMKNFLFKNLVTINPQCDVESEETRCRAKHANDVIDRITKYETLSVAIEEESYDYVIGTTGKLGNDYNIKRSPLTPKQLAKKIAKVSSRSKIAIVFGRESQGLSNEELGLTNFTVSIPANDKYSVLNLSHAVTIIAYELFQERNNKNNKKNEKVFTPIQKKDKEILLGMINDILSAMKFNKGEDQKQTQEKVWDQLISKAMMTRREAFAIMGFFRKLLPKEKK